MSIDLKNIELVDRYLSGDLSAAEKQAFQTRLQSDSALQELLSDFQATNELVKASEMAQIKAQLDSFSYEAAPWWQSTAAKFAGAVAVTAVVMTAVWTSMPNEKPAAKETVAVAQKESVKEKNNTATSPAQKEQRQKQTRTIVYPPTVRTNSENEPSSNFPFVPSVIAPVDSIKEENAAPLTPVTTPTGPVAPPQRDSVASNAKGTTTTPGPVNPTPAVEVEAPKQRNFSIQLPTQSWTYPDHMRNGSLRIMNEAGALINELNLNANTDNWNGTDRYGNTVPSGLYFYQYTDASGQQYSGSITVVY